MVQPGQDREPDRWIARPRGDSSSRRYFVECERETRRAIAAGERDMLAQHTDESFRADDVSFRNAGGAVVQVLMRSDFFATEAFFCDHGRHPFLEQRHVRYAGGDLVYYQRRSSPTIRPLRPTSFSDRRAPESAFDSTFWRKNDTEQHSFVPAYLPGSADMRTTIRRDRIVDLVIGNRRLRNDRRPCGFASGDSP